MATDSVGGRHPASQDAAAGHERSVVFTVDKLRLHGIISHPVRGSAPTIGVVMVAGGAQTRTGANRRFVELARRLAREGYAVIRFDQRGLGDSEGEAVGFENASADLHGAWLALRAEVPSLHSCVPIGLCDGASAAVLALPWSGAECLGGLVLINPWIRSAELDVEARHRQHYRRRVADPRWWLRLLRGGVSGRAVLSGLCNWWRTMLASRSLEPTFVDVMAERLRAHKSPVLVLLSGRDFTAQAFEHLLQTDDRWRTLAQSSMWTIRRHDEADHTHTDPQAGRRMEDDIATWLQSLAERTHDGH